jgi:hypothetical protein
MADDTHDPVIEAQRAARKVRKMNNTDDRGGIPLLTLDEVYWHEIDFIMRARSTGYSTAWAGPSNASSDAAVIFANSARSPIPHIRTDDQPVTQITVIEPDPGKQAEALSLMTERARFMARQPGSFPSASLAASMGGASSTTSNGRVAISCDRLIKPRNSARSGITSIS